MWSWDFRKLRYKDRNETIPSVSRPICLIHPLAPAPVSVFLFLCWGWKKLWEAGFKKIGGGVRQLGAVDFHRMT